MLSGVPVIYGIKPMEESSTPLHELGSIGVSQDGRRFRYVKAGSSALVAGELLQASVEDTALQSIAMAAASIGATEVVTTGTVTVTNNEYAGGYVVMTGEGGTGNGLMYKIKSHPAATGAVCTFQLDEPIKVAITTSTQCDFVRNPFNGVIQMPSTPTSAPVGVAVIANTAAYYGWIQDGGIAIVKNDASGAITVGNLVTASQTTAGCINQAANGSTEAHAPIGVAVTGIAQAEFGAVKLLLA